MRQHFAEGFVDLGRAGLAAESVAKPNLASLSPARICEGKFWQKPPIEISYPAF